MKQYLRIIYHTTSHCYSIFVEIFTENIYSKMYLRVALRYSFSLSNTFFFFSPNYVVVFPLEICICVELLFRGFSMTISELFTMH